MRLCCSIEPEVALFNVQIPLSQIQQPLRKSLIYLNKQQQYDNKLRKCHFPAAAVDDNIRKTENGFIGKERKFSMLSGETEQDTINR